MRKNVSLSSILHMTPYRSLCLLDLVWSSIGENLSSLVSIWWEHSEIVDKLNAFRRVRQIDISA